MSFTIHECLQHEENLENGFKALLNTACPNVYHSRESDLTISPRIELKAIVGKVQKHQHRFPSGKLIWDVWDGKLQTTIFTNRTTELKSQAHRILIGQVRVRLQMFSVVGEWRMFQDIALVTDIREEETDDSELDTSDLDVTRIAWYLLFNVNPEAWPTNL